MARPANPSIDSVRLYLQEIGRYPLLKKHEEILLATQIQQGLRISPTLSIEGLSAEDAAIVAEAKRSKDKLIRANLRLVVMVAKRFAKMKTVELLDLIQEGNLGLSRAADKFQPSKGCKFSTYAYWWIRQGITRAMGDKSRTIRLPIHVNEKISAIRKVVQTFYSEEFRNPTIAEIAELTGFPLSAVILLTVNARPVSSLDVTISNGKDKGETAILDLQSDELLQPIEAAIALEQKEILARYLSVLCDRDRTIMELRHGLRGEAPLSLACIGDRLGICRERVRQIQTVAMRKIRTTANREYPDEKPEFLEAI